MNKINYIAPADRNIARILVVNILAVIAAVAAAHTYLPFLALSAQLWLGLLAGSTVVWGTTMIIGGLMVAAAAAQKAAQADRNVIRLVVTNVLVVIAATAAIHTYLPYLTVKAQLWLGFLAGSTAVWATTMVVGALMVSVNAALAARKDTSTENYTLATETKRAA